MTGRHHFLILAFPVQSHINPTLQLAKRLIRLGSKVTFATAASACRIISKTTPSRDDQLAFAELPEFAKLFGIHDDDDSSIVFEIKQGCCDVIAQVISRSAEEDRWPVTCMLFSPTLPWLLGLAHQMHKQSFLFWIQPATVLVIFYHFFLGYRDVVTELCNRNTLDSIELPGLTLPLAAGDLPTVLLPTNPQPSVLKLFEEQNQWLAAQENAKVLVNTFELLEPEALKAAENLNLIPIGPLVPSVLLDGNDTTGKEFGGDLYKKTEEYVDWLNSKPESSVVYISFGSIWGPTNEQMEELARALLDAGRPFLWIIKAPGNGTEEDKAEKVIMGFRKELDQLGLIVPWCSQVEVLSHPSIGCFLTHCGWNSTLESQVAGVPMVGFPLSIEQTTNAKLVEDYWKTGVRVSKNEDGLVARDEIRRCLELVMGSDWARKDAQKWRELAVEAAREGGPADRNLRAFLSELEDSA